MKAKALAIIALPLLARAALAEDGQIEFESPTHNLCCSYTPAGGTGTYTTPDGSGEMVCDRERPTYLRVSLTENGRYEVYRHVGDAHGCGSSDALAYGDQVSLGGFTCLSAENGITCKLASGRGFHVSRAGVKKLRP